MPRNPLLVSLVSLLLVGACTDRITEPVRPKARSPLVAFFCDDPSLPDCQTADPPTVTDPATTPEVQSMETTTNQMGSDIDAAAASGIASVSVSGEGGASIQSWAAVGGSSDCNGGFYATCVTLCYGYADGYRATLGAFWQADDEYWSDVIKGSSYLVNLPGGPMEKMRAALSRMRLLAANYNLNNCHNYLYG